MKTIFSRPPILILALLFTAPIFGQCIATPTDPCLEVNQSIINKAAAVADELKAAREVVAKFQVERATTDVERAAAQTLIKSFDALLLTKDRIIVEYERIQGLYKQVIDFQQKIIENLEKQLNRPKSFFQKLLATLKTIATIAFGIGIGRSL